MTVFILYLNAIAGIFAPLSKVTRLVAHPPSSTPPAGMAAGSGKINTTHVTAKVNTGLADASRRGLPNLGIEVGDRVVVAGQKLGTVLFVGNTTFAPGKWVRGQGRKVMIKEE